MDPTEIPIKTQWIQRTAETKILLIRVKTKQKMNMTGKKTGTKTDFLIWDAACAASLFI